MSCTEGLGDCCQQPEPVNIFGVAEHHFTRHLPMVADPGLAGWQFVEKLPPAEAEACQDGYLKRVWKTTYDHSVNGVIVRTRTYEHSIYTQTPIEDTDTHPTINNAGGAYPVNYLNTAYTDWGVDTDWMGDNPTITTNTPSQLHCAVYFQNIYDPSIKLIVITEITLSLPTTYTAFQSRCQALYWLVNEAALLANVPPTASGGQSVLWFHYDAEGGLACDGENNSAPLQWDVWNYYTLNYWWGATARRRRGVTMATVAGPDMANPYQVGDSLKLREWSYPGGCFSNYPYPQTENYTCTAITNGDSIFFWSAEHGHSLLHIGPCPP